MNILITGAAGFIGSAVAASLAAHRHRVVGIDNLNSYYNPLLKIRRLLNCGFVFPDSLPLRPVTPASGSDRNITAYVPEIPFLSPYSSHTYGSLRFIRLDITDRKSLFDLCRMENFDLCINLAAQAGVRYSLENPYAYEESNINGFLNILEASRIFGIKHTIYASSSSVYGDNQKIPFSESDVTDSPVSLYAATKKCNEMFASIYAGTYGMRLTGLRFFTVYGPWGRPDMAPMLFADAVYRGEEIKVFNNGRMSRDFTYIDDIVEGVSRIAENVPASGIEGKQGKNTIYNIGHGSPVELMTFISLLEKSLGKSARLSMAPMQAGDVERTWADTSRLTADYDYTPAISLEEGIPLFTEWYNSHRNIFSSQQ